MQPRHLAIVCPNTRKMRRLIRGSLAERDDSELADPLGSGIISPIPLGVVGPPQPWSRPVVSTPLPSGVRLCCWCLPITELTADARAEISAIEADPDVPGMRVFVATVAETHAVFETRWKAAVNWPGDSRSRRPASDPG